MAQINTPNSFTNDDLRYRLLLKEELKLRKEQGGDINALQHKIDAYKSDLSRQKCIEFFKESSQLKVKYGEDQEPSGYREIISKRPKGPRTIKKYFSREMLYNKLRGGWYGRCIGCLLGKPVEGWDMKDIKLLAELSTGYPLSYYLGAIFPPPVDKINKRFTKLLVSRFSQKGSKVVHDYFPDGMPVDDDTNYTILNTRLLEKHGPFFTTEDVADSWLNFLPYNSVCTAEKIAYKNIVNNIPPPESARFLNPGRELIGAQIRADAFGYISPGMPEKAAAMAFKDANLSHVRNGIYGAMLVAAMVAMAFVTNDIFEIIDAGISEIPAGARLTRAVKDMVACWKKNKSWKKTMPVLERYYGKHLLHEGHAINNAAVVIIGLLEGRQDFEKGVCASVMCGYDADCNGATVGSILGIVHGADKIAEKWKAPLNDTIYTSLSGMHTVSISQMAEKSLDLALDMLLKNYPVEDLAKNELKNGKMTDYFYDLPRY